MNLVLVPEHVQPLRLFLAATGVADSGAALYNFVWRPLVFVLLLAAPVCLAFFGSLDTRLPSTLTGGTGLLSLTSVVAWITLSMYLRGEHWRRLSGFLLRMEASHMRARIRGVVVLYAWISILVSIVLGGTWIGVTYAGVDGTDEKDGKDDDDDTLVAVFLVVHGAAVVVSVSVFMAFFAVVASIAHMIRMLLNSTGVSAQDGSLSVPGVIRTHAKVFALAEGMASQHQPALVAITLLFPLSITFQLWGVFQDLTRENSQTLSDDAEDELNGIYYVVVYAAALVGFVTILASVNRKMGTFRSSAATLHSSGHYSFEEVNAILVYLSSVGLPVSIMGAPLSPAFPPMLAYFLFGLVGVLIHQLVY